MGMLTITMVQVVRMRCIVGTLIPGSAMVQLVKVLASGAEEGEEIIH